MLMHMKNMYKVAIAILVIMVSIAVAVWETKTKEVSESTVTEITEQETQVVPVEKDFKIVKYSNYKAGIEFDYPSSWGEVSMVFEDGNTGKLFRGSFSNAYVVFGGMTKDYEQGRGGMFTDFAGYTNSDLLKPRYANHEKFLTDSGLEIILLENIEISQQLSKDDIAVWANLKGPEFYGVAFRFSRPDEINKKYFKDMLLTIDAVQKIDSSAWVQYRNNKHQYTIKYPNNFKGGEADFNADRAYFYSASRDFEGESSYLSVEVIISEISIDDWWTQYDSKDAVKYELREELSLAGVASKRYRGLSGMYSDHLVLKKNGKIYHLTGLTNEGLFIEFIKTLTIK